MKKIGILLASLVIASSTFAANFCSDSVIDETGVLNAGQVSEVAKSTEKLTRLGVDTRIRVLADLKGSPTLEALKTSAQKNCGSWRASAGGMKNNLLIVMVAPKQHLTGLFYGDALSSKLNSKQLVIQTEMNAKFRDGNITGGIVTGLTDVADLMEVKISQQGAPVVINHAADTSGFSNVLGWIVGLLAFAGLVYVLYLVFRQKERRRGAQNDAKTEQGRCTAALNGFETPSAVLRSRVNRSSASVEKKARLIDRLSSVQLAFEQASAEFDAVNRGNNNPETPNLSDEEYKAIGLRFAKIADRLEAVVKQLPEIELELNQPEVASVKSRNVSKANKPATSSFSNVPPVNGGQTTSQQASVAGTRNYVPPTQQPVVASASSAPPVSEIQHTTIVNNSGGNDGFLTGILVGDMLNRDHGHGHHHYDDDDRPSVRSSPHEEPPLVTNGGGSDTTWGKTSEGGGSETGWGKSSEGEGRASSWDNPSFGGSSSHEDTTPARDDTPSNCQASDCQASDCQASDCSSSDSGGGGD